MKKITCILLIILLTLSFSSCRQDTVPAAKELAYEAAENTKEFELQAVMGLAAVSGGESISATLKLDGRTDDKQNSVMDYFVSVPSVGFNFSGKMYILAEKELYIQALGTWYYLDLNSAYEDEGYSDEPIKKAEELESQIGEEGYSFSEVTSTEDSYTFDTYFTDKFTEIYSDFIIDLINAEEKEAIITKEDEEKFLKTMDTFIKNISFKTEVDKKSRTYKSVYMDLTDAFNELVRIIQEDIEEEIRKHSGDYESEIVPETPTSFNNVSIDITYSNVGNVEDVIISDTIKNIAADIMTLAEY